MTDQRPADEDGQVCLWEPTTAERERAWMTGFMRWVGEREGKTFADYEQLREWSVTELERFWEGIWEYFGVRCSRPYERVLDGAGGCRARAGLRVRSSTTPRTCCATAKLRGARGGGRDPDQIAVLHASELRDQNPPAQLTWGELAAQVAAVAGGLRALGVERGDRVVAYMPNIPETLIAFLASASVGAIFSSAAPEFGARSVIDRFAQIEPKVVLAVDGYRHGGKDFDRRAVVGEILAELPTVRHTVLVPYLSEGVSRAPAPSSSASHGTSNSSGARGAPPDPMDVPPASWPGALTWRELRERGEGSELRVRAGALRTPAVGAVLLGHDRPAEGDRAQSRRDPAGAAEEEPSAPRPASQATACSGSRRPAG